MLPHRQMQILWRPQPLLSSTMVRQALLVTLLAVFWSTVVYSDTSVRVRVPSQPSLLFLVSVSTHHADLHNGHSKTRFQQLLTANEAHRVPLEFFLTLTHLGAWAYHPDYLLASVRSSGRMSPLPDIEPRSWSESVRGLEELPLTGAGPTFARAVENVELFPKLYIPALDRAGLPIPENSLAKLTAFLEQAEQLAGIGDESSKGSPETAARLLRDGELALRDIARLMSLDRKQRVAMLEFRELILGPLPMIRALQQEPGFSRVPDYLALVAEGKDGAIAPSWHGQHVDVQFSYTRGDRYRFSSEKESEPLPCYRGQVQFDGRYLAAGVYPDLQASVEANFCRHPGGNWRLYSRWADTDR